MRIRAVTKIDYPVLGRMMTEFETYLDSLDPTAKPSRKINRAKALERIDLLDHGGAGLIAEDNGKALGYILYFPSASLGSMERTFSMPDFFVRKTSRGKGVGTKLIQALAEKARARRATSILWTVYDRNPKAMSFYFGIGAHVIRDEMIMAWEVPMAGRRRTSSAKLKKSRA